LRPQQCSIPGESGDASRRNGAYLSQERHTQQLHQLCIAANASIRQFKQ
jgi:hypothetical protein